MIDLALKEQEVLSDLVDFQVATVDRVGQLYKTGFRRVLIADEVGLGKTLVARGVIARMARYFKESTGKDIFKVIYICSNLSIAGQNLKKLKIHDEVKIDGITDTRLSMQHLKIFEQRYDPAIQESFIQLIPLTPHTSFSMTGGCGSVRERALIYSIIKRLQFFSCYMEQLNELMTSYATVSWKDWVSYYDKQVIECDQASKGNYLGTILEMAGNYLEMHPEIFQLSRDVFSKMARLGYSQTPGANRLILKFRKMMAEISVEMLEADLVIMDEFQRFPDLLKSEANDEKTMLAKKFFKSENDVAKQPYILLLSATPYKLYSTLEEIQENQRDEHYEEFKTVVKFLFECNPCHYKDFISVWNNYSICLNEVVSKDLALIIAQKRQAEEKLYKGICRTERIQVRGAEAMIDAENNNRELNIHEDDILSYVEMDKAARAAGLGNIVPVEYIKSAPFIMSFMQHYKLKQKLIEAMKKNPQSVNSLKSHRLWINQGKISRYQPLDVNHARLKGLKKIAMPQNAEYLLWVPPSRPYYELEGPFTNQKGFSKTLVFSAWEMVPRAIAALLSYEAERLSIGKLVHQTPDDRRENRSYFAKVRFPSPRITFSMKDGAPANMNHLCLLYPSPSLASMYDPLDSMNMKKGLKEIKLDIGRKIEEALGKLSCYEREDLPRDDRWYFIAPVLMDINNSKTDEWFNEQLFQSVSEKVDLPLGQDEKKALFRHLEQLKSEYNQIKSNQSFYLGAMPKDLVQTLVNMAIASPAVCGLRMLGADTPGALNLARHLAKTIVDRFNIQEAIAIVELQYGKTYDGAHWKNVLRYCVDGNIQAMLDEYAHMLAEGSGLKKAENNNWAHRLIQEMMGNLAISTASYNVDTYPSFKSQVQSRSNKKQASPVRMRSRYAVGFYDAKSEGENVQRKDNLRLSFNSPFRPFVLATTSIGQEGLDFHYYCRNIVHWNLPANPVDLEQREGRINRYKCLAIRQSIANRYGDICFHSDIWQEMFQFAKSQETNSQTSELVPFWCLPEKEESSNLYSIQRILLNYPMSRDEARYRRLIKILSLYRLSLGHARQEELVEYLFNNNFSDVDKLFMNLSPYFRKL